MNKPSTIPKKKKALAQTVVVDYVAVYSQFFKARPDAVTPEKSGGFRIVDGFDYGLRTTTDSGTGRYLNGAN